MSTRKRQNGFTLFEVLIVVFLIAIAALFIAPNLSPNESSRVQDEAERLALLMKAMQQEAVLKFRNYAFQAYPDHYLFLAISPGSDPQPMEDIFRPRKMPEDVTIKVDKDANNVVSINAFIGKKEQQTAEDDEQQGEKPPEPELSVIILATGEVTPFSLRFVSLEGAEYTIEGSMTGQLKTYNPKKAFLE